MGQDFREDLTERVADELRTVADDLESGEIQRLEVLRHTRRQHRDHELPPEIEIEYTSKTGTRTVSIY